MRLFIAAELPQDMVDALAETSALLRDSVPGRYVPASNFHVTLAFLGDVPAARIPDIQQAVDDACALARPIEVRLGNLDCFGRGNQGLTLYQELLSAEGGKPQELAQLANDLRANLKSAGFAFDTKKFVAHITLMRKADLSRGVLPAPHQVWSSIETITLFKSDLSGSRPVYEELYRVFL